MLKPHDSGVAVGLDNTLLEAARQVTDNVALEAELTSRIGPGYWPHLTLFHGRFPGDAEQQVKRRLQRFAATIRPIEISMLGRLTLSPVGNVFWPAEITPQLRALHLRAYYAFRSLTKGLVLPLYQKMSDDPRFQEARLDRFGFLSAGERFAPHVTLCRLARPERDWAKVEQLRAPALRFQVRRLLLGRLGPAGNFAELVAEERLPEAP